MVPESGDYITKTREGPIRTTGTDGRIAILV